MLFQYPRSVWRGISIRLRQGESVASVSVQTGICQGTLYRWKHQALVDAGMKVGTPSPDGGDLVSARKRIRQLEGELAIVKTASTLYDDTSVVPNRKTAVGDGLVSLGFSARRSLRYRRPEPAYPPKHLRAVPSIRTIQTHDRGLGIATESGPNYWMSAR